MGKAEDRRRQPATPTRIVADADVLAADVFIDGPARAAIDIVRRHSWLSLVASDVLIDDAAAVVTELGDADLAAAWRDLIEPLRVRVDQPPGDHPALASALEGNAGHVLTLDPDLHGVSGNLALQNVLAVSVRTPTSFVSVFDPDGLFEATHEGPYPGPDRDPRAPD